MLQTLKTTFKLETSMSVNAFLFYFKRIPLIGKIFSDKIYQQVSLKTAISVLVFLLKIIQDVFIRTLFAGLLLFLPITMFYSEDTPSTQIGAFVHSLFILYCIISPFLFSEVFEASRPKVIGIKILHIPAKRYYIYHIFYKTLRDGILSMPAICIFTILSKGSFLMGLYFTLLIILFRIIGEAFHLFLFSKTKQMVRKHMIILVIFLVILLASDFVPVFMKLPLPTMGVVYSLPFMLAAMAVSACTIYYIINYSQYTKVFHASNKMDEVGIDKKKAVREATFRDVTLKEADLASSLQHQATYTNKRGYAFLNALFFERHRRMLLKPMLITIACIGVFYMAILTLLILVPEFSAFYIKALTVGYPALVFVMYILSIYLCQRATKAMFYNCDMSLLRYSYYRKKSVILSNFRLRLRRILAINGAPAIVIALGLLILTWVAQADKVVSVIPILILVLILSVFFSVHHLFMYYVFQPFTTDLDVKNPIYKVVNGIVYMASYICMQIRKAPSIFLIIILAVTIIYTIVALILILRLAPKNFRVK